MHTNTPTDTLRNSHLERERRKTEMRREKIVSCRLAKLHIRRTWARKLPSHTATRPLPNSKTKRPSRES